MTLELPWLAHVRTDRANMFVKSLHVGLVVASGVSRETSIINLWPVAVQQQLNNHIMLWLSDVWQRRNVSCETPCVMTELLCYDLANTLVPSHDSGDATSLTHLICTDRFPPDTTQSHASRAIPSHRAIHQNNTRRRDNTRQYRATDVTTRLFRAELHPEGLFSFWLLTNYINTIRNYYYY